MRKLPSLFPSPLSQSFLKWYRNLSVVCWRLNQALFLNGYVSVPMCIIIQNNYKGELSAKSKVRLLWKLCLCLWGRCFTDWFKHSLCLEGIWELCFVNCVHVDWRGQLCSLLGDGNRCSTSWLTDTQLIPVLLDTALPWLPLVHLNKAVKQYEHSHLLLWFLKTIRRNLPPYRNPWEIIQRRRLCVVNMWMCI